MVYSLIVLRDWKKKKKKTKLFFIINSFWKLFFFYKNFILNDFNFYVKKLTFFLNINSMLKGLTEQKSYTKFIQAFLHIINFNTNNCIKNMKKIINRIDFINIFSINTSYRNFFINFFNFRKSTFLSGGFRKNYRPGMAFRSRRFRGDNLIKSIKKHYKLVLTKVIKHITFVFKKINKRLTFIIRTYMTIFKFLNRFFKLNKLKIRKITINRCKIFGYMRGERKPRRRKAVRKKNRKIYN